MAVTKSKANEGEAATQTSKKNKGGILKIVAIALGSVIMGVVVVGALAYFIGIPGLAPKAKAAQPVEMDEFDPGEMVINLADSDGSRFLRVKMVLEYPQNEKLKQEIESQRPLIMQDILHVLRNKTVDDVRPVAKEDKVKAEIIETINKELKAGEIQRIYFTDFLIQ